MTREEFERRQIKGMTYDEYAATRCKDCAEHNCPHRDNFRRLPISAGGLGLCANLENSKELAKGDV